MLLFLLVPVKFLASTRPVRCQLTGGLCTAISPRPTPPQPLPFRDHREPCALPQQAAKANELSATMLMVILPSYLFLGHTLI